MEGGLLETKRLETLKQIAAGIAAQFGDKCEVVIHDVSSSHPEHTIVHIENGHVSGRKVGDGASMVVLEQLEHQHEQPQDHLCYLTRTPDGKILKSSSLYIRNSRGAVTAIFSINYDVTGLMMMQRQLTEMLSTQDKEQTEPEKIINVNDVLVRYSNSRGCCFRRFYPPIPETGIEVGLPFEMGSFHQYVRT